MQFLAGSSQELEQQLGSGRIGEGCRSDDHWKPQSERIHQDMAFAPFHTLATLIAPHSGKLSRFDALAIQRASGWLLMATSCPLTDLSMKRVVNSFPGPILTELSKVGVHALPR